MVMVVLAVFGSPSVIGVGSTVLVGAAPAAAGVLVAAAPAAGVSVAAPPAAAGVLVAAAPDDAAGVSVAAPVAAPVVGVASPPPPHELSTNITIIRVTSQPALKGFMYFPPV